MTAFEFVQLHQRLLELEKAAELEESRSLLECTSSKQLVLKGVCLSKLSVASQSTGLYGRTLITLQPTKDHGIASLPANNFSSGDIVGLYPSQGVPTPSSQLLSGLVWQIRSAKVIIAVDNHEEQLGNSSLYMLIKLANDITYKRLRRALEDLSKSTNSHGSHLREVLFGEAALGSPLNLDLKDVKFFNQHLDASQKDAVCFALNQPEVAVIHGPPGTGKTTTVVEIILQAIRQGQKVVACAPSNVAVDNLMERLAANQDVRAVRIGHPARLLPGIQRFSLDAQLAASDAGKLLLDIRKEIDSTLESSSKMKRKTGQKGNWNELRILRKELREREKDALKLILSHTDVVLATNTGISGDSPVRLLNSDHFQLVVIDECAQAIEAGCWIPLRLARRCVLAGDHLQLPPTVISEKAAKEGLSVSLMERIIKLYGNQVVRMLSTQYRMHSDIMQWSSGALYDGQIVAHSSVSGHLLRDLPGVEDNEVTSIPLLLIDTLSCGYEELTLEDEVSKGNEGEANLVALHVDKICASGVRPHDIAVITPYNLQVELIRQRLLSKFPGLEIKSVDGFQGREKEAVVMSLVRSNSPGQVGFLVEDRRLNVAVTRARRHLCLICDSQTVSHHPFIKDLLTYVNSHGEVHSAFQYTQELDNLSWDFTLPDHVASKKQSKPTSVIKSNSSKSLKSQSGGTKTLPVKKLEDHANGKVPRSSSNSDDSVTEELRIKYQKDLNNFKGDYKKQEIIFSAGLSPRDRFVLHEISEQMNLYHASQGEGKERYIIVSKIPIAMESSQCTEILPLQDILENPVIKMDATGLEPKINLENSFAAFSLNNVETISVDVEPTEVKNNHQHTGSGKNTVNKTVVDISTKKKDGTAQKIISHKNIKCCQFCGKHLPPGNLLLHEIQCERTYELRNATNVREKHLRKMDQSKQKNTLERTNETEFDELVKLAKKQDRLCNYRKCKEIVELLGQLCEFCNKRYCLSHHIPEVHGCGELAKHKALKGRKTDINKPKERKSDAARKSALQRKLKSKLGDLEENRQRKGKKK